jgi:hypothetical protein
MHDQERRAMNEYKIRITDQTGQSARLVFRVPYVGRTTWEVLDPGKLSMAGGSVDSIRPKAYLARESALDAKVKAWRAAEIAKAGNEPLAHLAARALPAPPMTNAPAPDWMHALLQVDDCLWHSESHMKSSHPNYGTAIALSSFVNKQFMVGLTRTGAGLLYHKYARGLRPGAIKWEIESAPCRVQSGDDMQNWPLPEAVKLAMRMASDLPLSRMFQ